MKTAVKMEQIQAMTPPKQSVYSWFSEFEKFIQANIIQAEDRIYNCDESGFPIQPGSSMRMLCHR